MSAQVSARRAITGIFYYQCLFVLLNTWSPQRLLAFEEASILTRLTSAYRRGRRVSRRMVLTARRIMAGYVVSQTRRKKIAAWRHKRRRA